VKRPVINVEEEIHRTVGRRTGSWRRSFGGVRVPRGVYRFKTHEEADQWLWRMIARPTS
jgi:hypothetical protein